MYNVVIIWMNIWELLIFKTATLISQHILGNIDKTLTCIKHFDKTDVMLGIIVTRKPYSYHLHVVESKLLLYNK